MPHMPTRRRVFAAPAIALCVLLTSCAPRTSSLPQADEIAQIICVDQAGRDDVTYTVTDAHRIRTLHSWLATVLARKPPNDGGWGAVMPIVTISIHPRSADRPAQTFRLFSATGRQEFPVWLTSADIEAMRALIRPD